MAAPVVMICLWTLASILRPGYDQLTQEGSELGTGPNSLVMNANFVVTGVFFPANSHRNRGSLLCRDGPLPHLNWNRSEPGSTLDTLSFIFPSDRTGEYRALHCIFCCCPNLISLRGIVTTILSRYTVSMDRDNGESAALFHKVSKKFGCKIAAPYQLLGR